jgi:hypothetical protein
MHRIEGDPQLSGKPVTRTAQLWHCISRGEDFLASTIDCHPPLNAAAAVDWSAVTEQIPQGDEALHLALIRPTRKTKDPNRLAPAAAAAAAAGQQRKEGNSPASRSDFPYCLPLFDPSALIQTQSNPRVVPPSAA